MPYPAIENKSILTPTCGFLGPGFTHTINAYSGCAFANTLCGRFCYAQHNHWITKGRAWGFYGAKRHVASAYQREYERLKRPRRRQPRPLRIFMSSSTDPYVPQERSLGLTRSLLEAMVDRPPDVLVIQTHMPLIARDLELITNLSNRSSVRVSITVETDREAIPGFPPHASSPADRVSTLRQFRQAGVPTQATVSPMLPVEDINQFARNLGEASDRIILDHYLLGDGSPGGLRTKRTGFPATLAATGYGDWNSLDRFWEVVSVFRKIVGHERILISESGFNTE